MEIRKIILASIIIIVLLWVGLAAYFLYTLDKVTIPSSKTSVLQDTISHTEIDLRSPSTSLVPILDSYKSSFLSDNNEYNIHVINASFLHNNMRNYYGDSAPSQLNVLWKHLLGQGTTQVGLETKIWKGAGWTGQPLLVVENNKKYLIQGAYDHHLKKINAETGELVWQYQYDDVIKGTGSIWINPNADSLKNFCIILQGSRAGKSIYSSHIPSYRAISYFTGEELWRLNSAKTASYSRDVDASALILNDTAYIGLENGIFTIFNPNPKEASIRDKMLQPQIYKNTDTLYRAKDNARNGGNLVTEASPTLLGDRIYIASGSGHIWGYNLKTHQLDWDYYVGSDIDGSAVVTADSCLLIAIEKQYINGRGGLLKLNPKKAPKDAAEWFFPTADVVYSTWFGGIVGSPSVNYHYKKSTQPDIAAFTAIDGFMYVINTSELNSPTKFPSYDSTLLLPQPKLLYKYKTGASISTPIIVQNKIVAASYKALHLFEFNESLTKFELKSKLPIRCESTPVADNGRIYIASRNGYLYCLGG